MRSDPLTRIDGRIPSYVSTSLRIENAPRHRISSWEYFNGSFQSSWFPCVCYASGSRRDSISTGISRFPFSSPLYRYNDRPRFCVAEPEAGSVRPMNRSGGGGKKYEYRVTIFRREDFSPAVRQHPNSASVFISSGLPAKSPRRSRADLEPASDKSARSDKITTPRRNKIQSDPRIAMKMHGGSAVPVTCRCPASS